MKKKNKDNSSEDATILASSAFNEQAEQKKICLRKCVSCATLYPSKQLLRITKCHKTGELIIQPDSKQFGRSAYICYNKECIKAALKKKRLQRILKVQLTESFINKLEDLLN